MIIDKRYCMSSFLMFRSIIDENKAFFENAKPSLADISFSRTGIRNSNDLYQSLKHQIEEVCRDGKAALALSGGIDSAILAKFMPKGSMAYTFKCIVPGIEVIDETKVAELYAKECGLNHKIIEISWEDMERYSPDLMRSKNAPIHSIEVQIYKAALQAKADGYEKLIFGENADIIYGGMNGLLSRDWLIGDFIDRYAYVLPYKVIKEFELITEPFKKYTDDNGICDAYMFINDFFRRESLGSYMNACNAANVQFIGPFSNTYLAEPLDFSRIRNGEPKYLVREVFHNLYMDFTIPSKTPMPRPTTEWLKNWHGPVRPEFYPHCTEEMTGDQKWLVYILEKFLNLFD